MTNKTSNVSEESEEFSFGDFIINILSYILTIPAFLIFHRLLPNPDWFWHIDRILLFILAAWVTVGFLHSFKTLVLGAVLLLTGWLSYGSIWGEYGFKSFYVDYKAVIHAMANPPKEEIINPGSLEPFPYTEEFDAAVDYTNPMVRDFAIMATKKYFSDVADYTPQNRDLIQYFAVFKEVNQWHYVNDPKRMEYFSPASQTIRTMAGDCDDHSILMAAAIEAIGGTVRLVVTTNHIYPELLIENKADLENANYLIKMALFRNKSAGKRLYFHPGKDGQFWLNLDYTSEYPGGPFKSEEILSVYYPEH